MRAEFSEFSYGFAFTYGLVKVLPQLRIAPLFPSLRKESKLGFDVKLSLGFPIFFQYKLSDRLTRPPAKYWGDYQEPYFRFNITSLKRSDQHNRLKKLADTDELVYYAAPLFVKEDEFTNAYINNDVADHSIWLPVEGLPCLQDDDEHHVTFLESRDPVWHSEEQLITGDFSAQSAYATIEARFERAGVRQVNMGDYLPDLRDRLLGILRESDVASTDPIPPAAQGAGVAGVVVRLLATYFGLHMVVLEKDSTP